jgi:osmotically-inducible protein OsmY
MMKRLQRRIGGLIGAAVMFFLDPQRGNRRRALVRDQMASLANKTEDVVDVKAEDMKNRAQGMVAETKSRLKDEMVSDQVLVERVRAEMGRVNSHPGAIEVSATDGHVTLTGPILAKEVDALMAATKSIPGVKQINNQLEVHEEPGNIPSLQGKGNIPAKH